MGKIDLLSFCEQFGYPPQIRVVLQKVIDIIVESLKPVSILLLGSASRGEITYHTIGNNIDLLSDFEFLIVVKRGSKTPVDLVQRLEKVEESMEPKNPLFHIDYGLARLDQLPNIRRTIRTFEMKCHGKIVYGQNLIHYLPNVNLMNLDRGWVRTLVLIRLANQLFLTPRKIVLRKPSEYEQLIFDYITARNILDIPTILLPLSRSGVLLSSYADRVSFISDHLHEQEWVNIFEEDFVHLLKAALRAKLQLTFDLRGVNLYASFIQNYERLICYLLGISSLLELSELCEQILSKGLRMLENASLKWRVYENFLAFRCILATFPRNPLRWLIARKREICVCFLLHMHHALLSYLRGDEATAWNFLLRAVEFQRLLPIARDKVETFSKPNRQFSKTWLSMRRQFLEQLAVLLRMSNRIRNYYRKTLEWQYEQE